MRIYADESGTHGTDWLVIGMLFVPDHGTLHPALCKIKEEHCYLNKARRNSSARYKETHFAEFQTSNDVTVAKAWIDRFLLSDSYYRAVVVEWSVFQGRFFGTPFEPEALKKRKAYKKWAEMLLHPEVKKCSGAIFILDRLEIMYGYDVIDHLRDRFTRNYEGSTPRIRDFQAVASWKDAHQCLQLCDLLTGCVFQSLVPSRNPLKLETRDYLYEKLKPGGVREMGPKFWRGFEKTTLSRHFPKFSEWFWKPER